MRFLELAPALAALDWDESQHPRGQPENAGEFAKAPGGGAKGGVSETPPKSPKAVEFVSPNVEEGTRLKQARRALKGRRHNFITQVADEVDKGLGLKPEVHPVIGMWADGAENSTMSVISSNPPWDVLVQSAAMKGHLANQKQVLIFKEGETDPSHGDDAALATFRAHGDAGEISEWLGQNGLPYHTLEPISEGEFDVHVYGADKETGHAVMAAGEHYGSTVEVRRGRGAFLGTTKEDGSADDQRADARAVYSRLLDQSGDEGTAKLWQRLRDRYGREADQIEHDQIETPQFKKWFGDSKIVDADGAPRVLYHGTMGDFSSFDTARANPESNWGAGIYFTNDRNDLSVNYAGRGPDMDSKLENLADQIEQDDEFEGNHADALREAERRMDLENEGNAIPVYMRMEQPFKIGGKDETFLDYDMPYDEETEEYGEPGGKAQDLIDAIRELGESGEYFDADGVENLVNDLQEHALDNGGIQASKLELIASGAKNYGYVTDADGKLVASEILRKALEKIGYDGIIDTRVSQKFPRMGLKPTTTHYIVFDPHQVKSAIGNRGTFDPQSTAITDSMYAADAYNPNQPRIPKGEPGGGQWTKGGGGLGFEETAASTKTSKIYKHDTGTLVISEPSEKEFYWKFTGKSGGEESGDDQESLNKFLHTNKEALAPKPPEVPTPESLGFTEDKNLTSDNILHLKHDKGYLIIQKATGRWSWKPDDGGSGERGEDKASMDKFLAERAAEFTEKPKVDEPQASYEMNMEAADVGGDEWNKALAHKLESDYQKTAHHALDKIVKGMIDSGEVVAPPPDPDSDDDEDQKVIPEEWDMLSEEQQEDAKQKWIEHNKEDYHQSEVDNWHDNGDAKAVAAENLANDPDNIRSDLDEWIEDWNEEHSNSPVRYTADDLWNTMQISDGSKYKDWGAGSSSGPNPDIEFVFTDEKPIGFDPAQQLLPGFEPLEPGGAFTDEQRDSLTEHMKAAFEKQVDKDEGDVDPPEYLWDSVNEYMDEAWDQKDDDEKFSLAKDYLDSDIFEQDEPEDDEEAEGEVAVPPSHYDPLNAHGSTTDYRRTQAIAKAASVQRAADLLIERGLAKVTPEHTMEKTRDKLYEAQNKFDPPALLEAMRDGKPLNQHGGPLRELLGYAQAIATTPAVNLMLQKAEGSPHTGDAPPHVIAKIANAQKFASVVASAIRIKPGDGDQPTRVAFDGTTLNALPEWQHNYYLANEETIAHAVENYLFQHHNDLAMSGTTTAADVKQRAAKWDSQVWQDWVSSSTSVYGKLIQLAAADELGGRVRLPGPPPLPDYDPEKVPKPGNKEIVDYWNTHSMEDVNRRSIQGKLRASLFKVLDSVPEAAGFGVKDQIVGNMMEGSKFSLTEDGQLHFTPGPKMDALGALGGYGGTPETDEGKAAMRKQADEIEDAISKDLINNDSVLQATINGEMTEVQTKLWNRAIENAKNEAILKWGKYAPMSDAEATEKARTTSNAYALERYLRDALKDEDYAGKVAEGPIKPAQIISTALSAIREQWVPAVEVKDHKVVVDPAKLKLGELLKPEYKAQLDKDRPVIAEALRKGLQKFVDDSEALRKQNIIGEYKSQSQNSWGTKQEIIDQANSAMRDIGGYEGMKALMRAKWETSQWLLEKAGIHTLKLFRGMAIPGLENEHTEEVKGSDGREYTAYPHANIIRAGAQSTSLNSTVSNNWAGGSGDRHVTVRYEVPRTAVLSLPAYGKNVHSEREVVITGGAIKGWDAWRKAPEFDVIPVGAHLHQPEGAEVSPEQSQ